MTRVSWTRATLAMLVASAALASLAGSPKAAASAAAATVQGSASSTSASLDNGMVRRAWSYTVGNTGLHTVELRDRVTGGNWSAPAGDDVNMTVNGVVYDSTAWTVVSATATAAAPDPSRPANVGGQEITFHLTPALTSGMPPGLDLRRTYTVYPGTSTIEAEAQLVNDGAAAVQVKAYSLDQVTSLSPGTTEVQAYNGGSDWRDDFRHVTAETGTFDDEGEALRVDDGAAAGWFLVGERRDGPMSRAGRDSADRTWVGVDNARDVADLGPLASSPPNYNREPNPAYPAGGRFRTVPAGVTLELGRAYTGVYHGGAQEAARAFARDFFVHGVTPYARTVGLNSFHPWGHAGCAANGSGGLCDTEMRQQALAGQALGLDSVMLDDQWQGSSAGDWNFDNTRFPDSDSDGVPDWIDFLHAQGLQPALWMSPVEFNPGSQTYSAHPDWACAPTGDLTARIQDASGLGIWDVNNAAFRAYFASLIDRAISRWGIREFKFDFQVWVDCGPAADTGLPHDYLDYEDSFVAIVRDLQRAHPGVAFELDETNDQRLFGFRSVALGASWFDNGHVHTALDTNAGYVAKQLHDLWSAAPWLPPSSIGFGTYDGYLQPPFSAGFLMPMSVLSHFTFWTDLTKLSAADAAETAWWVAWDKAHQSDVGSFVYEDTTADPNDGSSWLGLQPWTDDHGYLFAFRQNDDQGVKTIPLQGVVPTETYRLTDVRTGDHLGTFTGVELRDGLAVPLPGRYTARVIEIEPIGPSSATPEAFLVPLLPIIGAAAVLYYRRPTRRRGVTVT